MHELNKPSCTVVKKSTFSVQQKAYFKNRFLEYLKKHKLRFTPQRDLILSVVLNSTLHLDAETLTNIIKDKDPSVGIATVYRTLRMMTSAKFLVERYFDGTRAQFEFIDPDGEHHDHIICLKCKKVVEFFNEELENLQIKIATDLKFKLQNHRMELFGVCHKCQPQLQQNLSGQ